jgi:hypothetical protein
MFTQKVKLLGLGLGLLALLFGGVFGGSSATMNCAAGQEAKDTRLKDLLKERLATLREIASRTKKAATVDQGFRIDELIEVNQAVLQTELELCEMNKERIAVLEKALAEAKDLENLAEDWNKKGFLALRDALKPKAARLRVEITLERAKAK